MEITYLGHSSFRIRGKSATVVTDPYDSEFTGLKFPRHISCDIVTVSHEHQDHNAVGVLEGSPVIIRGPGEYEVKGVGIIGLSVFHDAEGGAVRGRNTIYRIEIDGISLVHLGDLGHTLTTAQIESLDGVNILLVPVGGGPTIDAAKATEIIKEIDPAIVIPMHYGRAEVKGKFIASLAPVENFLKEVGKEELTPVPKFQITKDKLPEEMQVVILE